MIRLSCPSPPSLSAWADSVADHEWRKEIIAYIFTPHQHRHHEWELWDPELSYVVRFNKYSLIKKCFNLENFPFNLSNFFYRILSNRNYQGFLWIFVPRGGARPHRVPGAGHRQDEAQALTEQPKMSLMFLNIKHWTIEFDVEVCLIDNKPCSSTVCLVCFDCLMEDKLSEALHR